MARYFVRNYDGTYFQTEINPSRFSRDELLKIHLMSLFIPIIYEQTVKDKLRRLGRLKDMEKLRDPGDWILYLEE